MSASKIIKLLLLQFICVFIIIQVGLVSGGFSYLTILFWSFLIFAIVYAGFLAPKWKRERTINRNK